MKRVDRFVFTGVALLRWTVEPIFLAPINWPKDQWQCCGGYRRKMIERYLPKK